MKPGSTSVEPLVRKRLRGPQSMSTETVSNTACVIWHAMVRFQMSSYRRAWSDDRRARTESGSCAAEVGRTASCASCAFFAFVLYRRGLSGSAAGPKRSTIVLRMSAIASRASVSESVRR